MVTTVTDTSFKSEVLESKIPALVDFWASWCPPCKMVEPTIKEVSRVLGSSVRVAKINVDQNPLTASKYNIVGVPTFIVFESGRELMRCTGAQSRQQLLDMLKEAGVI